MNLVFSPQRWESLLAQLCIATADCRYPHGFVLLALCLFFVTRAHTHVFQQQGLLDSDSLDVFTRSPPHWVKQVLISARGLGSTGGRN